VRSDSTRPGLTPAAGSLAPAALLFAAVLAYHGSLAVPFFFDDLAAITNNPTIRNLRRIGEVLSPPAEGGGTMGRPVINLSLALNYAIGGTNPRGYHVFNLIVHALSALTLFGLARRTFAQPALGARFAGSAFPLSFVIALLWVVHPLQTESVSCVIQRTELLMGLFYLLTLYCFVRSVSEPAPKRWPALAIGCCALGMASKEVMISAPVMVVLYDRTFVTGSFRAAWQARRALYSGLAATWIILIALLTSTGATRGAAAGFGLGVSAWSYALKQCEAIVTYLRLSFWPHPLVMDYGTELVADPLQVAPHAAVILLSIAGMIAALRYRPALGFVMFWVFAILAPSSSVVPLVAQTMAEHRMYLPLAGVLSLGVVAVHRVAANRIVGLAALAAGAFLVATIARNRTMQDEVALWADTVAKAPTNPRAHGSLGLALLERGDARAAIPHFTRALELDPKSVATEQNLGNAFYRLGDFPAAAMHYRRAVALDPTFASGHNNLGAALQELRDPDGALQSYRTALALDPNHAGAHQNAARALFALQRFEAAAVHYEHVQRLNPTSAHAHYDLGLALARAGNIDRAAQHFAEALRLRPSAVSYLNYARFLADAGRIPDAIANLETALRLEPGLAEARRELERLRELSAPPVQRER
jgi:tetratricopeptide (TPR) repeat protein